MNHYIDSRMKLIIRLNRKLTHFFPMFPFDPPENIIKPKIFKCLKGDQKGTSGRNGLKSNEVIIMILVTAIFDLLII